MYEKGQVVLSLAGRDAEKLLAVKRSDDCFVYLCDGKERPLSREKRKKFRHVQITAKVLSEEQMASDRALRKALSAAKADLKKGR